MTDHPEPPPGEPHPEIEEQFSDLHDGTLTPARRAELLAHLEGCAACRAAHAEFEEAMTALGQLKGTPPAPDQFAEQVTETIHKRSAGRFFGRKTLGDRVPFGWLLIIAMIVLVGAALVLWSSATGSLRLGH